MESTVGGKDAAIEPPGWVDGVLTTGNTPAFSFSEQHCSSGRSLTRLFLFSLLMESKTARSDQKREEEDAREVATRQKQKATPRSGLLSEMWCQGHYRNCELTD